MNQLMKPLEDGAMEKQIGMMRESSFFGDELLVPQNLATFVEAPRAF